MPPCRRRSGWRSRSTPTSTPAAASAPTGAKDLAHPEPDLYLVGMKSYGRAPTFLAMTGYEQVRSVVAELAGDHEAAARIELDLPDTGVCGGAGLFDDPDGASAGGCCAAPGRPGADRRRAVRRLRIGHAGRGPRARHRAAPAARPGGAVRHGDRQLRHSVLRVPRPGRRHHRQHRLVQDGHHRRFLRRERRRRADRRGRRPADRPARSATGHDGRLSVIAAVALAGIAVAPTLAWFTAAWLLAGIAMAGVPLPACLRRPDRVVRPGAGASADHADPGGGIRQHHLRAAYRGAGRAARAGGPSTCSWARSWPWSPSPRMRWPCGCPGPARPGPGARPGSRASRCVTSWPAGRSCCW